MRPRVLMIAYACDPQGSGEHWLGWGWAEQAAHSYEVELLTTPKARAAVEASSRASGITPHFIDVPEWLRPFADLGWAGWSRKLAWQRRAVRVAAELHREETFRPGAPDDLPLLPHAVPGSGIGHSVGLGADRRG